MIGGEKMKNETEKTFRKLHEQYQKIDIRDFSFSAHNTEIVEAIFILESTYPGDGRVNYDYAKKVLISYKYSQDVKHTDTNNTLLQDIRDGKRITFNNYKK